MASVLGIGGGGGGGGGPLGLVKGAVEGVGKMVGSVLGQGGDGKKGDGQQDLVQIEVPKVIAQALQEALGGGGQGGGGLGGLG